MATYIKTLKEDNGDITYPQTKAEGVLLNNGSDLETELSQFVTAEDIASTSALTPPVQPNMIADGYRLVGYAVDDVPSEDTPNAWAAKLGGDGVYVTELTASRFSAQPAAVGTLRTTITSHYNRMEQEFAQLSGGVKYYRCGNNTGWWGQSGGSGAFRKIIDDGQTGTVKSQMIDWTTTPNVPFAWKALAGVSLPTGWANTFTVDISAIPTGMKFVTLVSFWWRGPAGISGGFLAGRTGYNGSYGGYVYSSQPGTEVLNSGTGMAQYTKVANVNTFAVQFIASNTTALSDGQIQATAIF